MPTPSIRFLRHRDVDLARYDAAVARDATCLPYGHSWWLRAVTAGKWDAVVLGDYRAVLPLPYLHRVGPVTQYLRAAFTQQAGPWGDFSDAEAAAMLRAIPAGAVRVILPLNERIRALPSPLRTESRTNLLLPLSGDITATRARYSKSLRKSIRKLPPTVLHRSDMATVLRVYRESSGLKAGLEDKHYDWMASLATACHEHAETNNLGISTADGDLLAVGFFPSYRGRSINLFAGSTPLGFELGGMAGLLDRVLEARSAHDHLFDFEGSSIPSIAAFFNRFRPEEVPYLRYRRTLW